MSIELRDLCFLLQGVKNINRIPIFQLLLDLIPLFKTFKTRDLKFLPTALLWYGPCNTEREGVSYRDPLLNIEWWSEIRVFGRVAVLFHNAYRHKEVLNKKGRRKDCEEVGSDQSFLVGKREPESFSPETRITIEDLASRSWKKSPSLSWNGEIKDRGAAR